MSSSNRYCGIFFVICACLVGTTRAQDFTVCPARLQDAVKQIYVFDGTPEEVIYLAPDDNTTASSLYSVSSIYDRGRFVTVRCKYKGGSIIDVQLKSRTIRCVFRQDKDNYGNLRCR